MTNICDFDFYLPENLIAQEATKNRGDSRLLVYKNNSIIHEHFSNIIKHLNPGDALVLNNIKVSKARLYGQKLSGGKIEILVLKPLDHDIYECFIKGLGQKINNTKIIIEKKLEAIVFDFQEKTSLYKIKALGDLRNLIALNGKIPLPPYIKREATKEDEERYQTVYAKDTPFGAVAAPTAGLHFTEDLLAKLKEKGVKIVEVTLHVGPGTFLPIKTHNIHDHVMHKEFFTLSSESANTLNSVANTGGRIIAVGTTSLRVLETVKNLALAKGEKDFFSYQGETDIFIKPGVKISGAHGLITNFHLPKTTLFILVSTIIGKDKALKVYEEAIEEKYRFFSYGDACFFTI